MIPTPKGSTAYLNAELLTEADCTFLRCDTRAELRFGVAQIGLNSRQRHSQVVAARMKGAVR
jgi:hypothetical protein